MGFLIRRTTAKEKGGGKLQRSLARLKWGTFPGLGCAREQPAPVTAPTRQMFVLPIPPSSQPHYHSQQSLCAPETLLWKGDDGQMTVEKTVEPPPGGTRPCQRFTKMRISPGVLVRYRPAPRAFSGRRCCEEHALLAVQRLRR